jgi:tetratricopeptide (TPR) repeat protein
MFYDPGERLEGERILVESPDDFGLLLWRTVRDVALWANTPPDARSNLFADGSADLRVIRLAETNVPPAVGAAVSTINGLLVLGTRADASLLAICCLEIACWAVGAGLGYTAVACAQAAAMASPPSAEAALRTGTLAFAVGQDKRAETWLRRAVAVARREKDRVAYSTALVELGVLYEGRGDWAGGERFYRLAYKAARRYAEGWSPRVQAAHGLFRLARMRGDKPTAARFAFRAQRAYRPDTNGGPELLLALGQFWRDVGEFGRAHAALRRLEPYAHQLSPSRQLLAAAVTARTHAAFWHKLKEINVKRALPSRAAATKRASAAWERMGSETLPDLVRFEAAVDLAHAARLTGDQVAFARAKRAVLSLAPRDGYHSVAKEIGDLRPEGAEGPRNAPTMGRAS